MDDIALNYRDPEGDLIRILDDEDIQLMIKEGRGQQGKVKRPVNQFPWELHVTLVSDFSVYNTEAWEIRNQENWTRYFVSLNQNNELYQVNIVADFACMCCFFTLFIHSQSHLC